jgi:hypothetical protein
MSHRPLVLLLALALAAVAADAVAGDESKPWSQIELGTVKQSDPDQYKLKLMAIDDRWDLTPETLYQLVPGPHRFIMATTKEGFRGEATYAEFGLEMQPCMNYRLVAVHQRGSNNREWAPTVTAAKPIKRCMKKFGIAASDAPVPTPTP